MLPKFSYFLFLAVAVLGEAYIASFVKSHMILFKRNKGMVEIIRILHQKMDFESNLD